MASLVTNNQNGEVKISKKKEENFIIITSQSVDLGENISTVEVDNSEAEFETYFNHRYIIEGLNCTLFENDKISMEFKQEKSPVLFKTVNKNKIVDNFIYMIMPIIKD